MSYCWVFIHNLLVRIAKAGGIVEYEIEEGHLNDIVRGIYDDEVDIAQIETMRHEECIQTQQVESASDNERMELLRCFMFAPTAIVNLLY